MKRVISLTSRRKLTGVLIACALMAAACSPAATPATPASTLTAAGGATVQVADSAEFGQILVTPDGRTLYTNTVDRPEDLQCINIACTGFWPPYVVEAEPTTGEEIPGLLGTITRPDGSSQVTYNQQPLYTFYLDNQPGEARGNGFTDFGGTWHVVSPDEAPAGSSTDSNA